MEVDDQITAADVQPPVSKKKAAASKKKVSKKKKKISKRKPAVELDAVGLERSVGYEDWEAAVSIRIDRGVNNSKGEHVDWDHGMIRHSYMWDGEVEVESFKKKHKKAISIEAGYPGITNARLCTVLTTRAVLKITALCLGRYLLNPKNVTSYVFGTTLSIPYPQSR